MPPTILFVHIPKTGGTSFRNSAIEYFGRERILGDYGAESAETSEVIKSLKVDPNNPVAAEIALADCNAALLAGHFHLKKYGSILGLPNTVTFIRDPVTRVISHYRHAIRDLNYSEDLMTFARDPKRRNFQNNLMAHLDPALIGFIGLTEYFNDSLAVFNHRWNCDLGYRKENIGDRRGSKQLHVTEEEKREIALLNAADESFYKRAYHVFGNSLYCTKQRLASDPRGGIIEAAASTGIRGWAFDLNDEAALEIQVSINDRIIGSTVCSEPIVEFAKWKLPRNGRVGFVVDPGSMDVGDRLEIHDVNHGLLLDKSVVT